GFKQSPPRELGQIFYLILTWWSAIAGSPRTETPASRVQVSLLPQFYQVAGITDARHHTRLIFVFLVETGFRHIVQANPELLTSEDPLTSASQSAGITGMNHRARPVSFIVLRMFHRDGCCLMGGGQ
uniref:Uncharacterized protein n=1 Tax=Papio anubis TaxID=9555 RepID=A0A8I5P341_PAPAN